MNPILEALLGAQQTPLERPDLSGQFNTLLGPEELARYQDWVKSESAVQGRDLGRDVADYDLPGFWKDQQSFGADARGHGPDTYKKPNHPTFSTGSKYAEGQGAGEWRESPQGMATFVAGPANLRYQTPGQLRDYFREVEPGVGLRTPTAAPRERIRSFLNVARGRKPEESR